MNYRCCMGVSRKFGRHRAPFSDSVKDHHCCRGVCRDFGDGRPYTNSVTTIFGDFGDSDSVKEHALMKEKVRKLREDAKKRLFGDFGDDDDDAKKVEIEKVAVDLLGEGERKEGDIKGDLKKKKNHKNKKIKKSDEKLESITSCEA